MNLKPQAYTFSDSDTKRIISLGYTITQEGSLSLKQLMVQEFPNFDLVALLEEVERSFTPATKLPIHRDIIFGENAPFLRIFYRNDYSAVSDALVFDRIFSKPGSGADIQVEHTYCVLPENEQGKGLIKNVFRVSLQQYVNMDLRKILVHAGLGQGGYVWAKHGFVATNKQEMQKILDNARKLLSDAEFEPVKHIFDKYYTDFPNGNAFPIILWAWLKPMKQALAGSDWHGELDLKDSKQFRNFINYVFR